MSEKLDLLLNIERRFWTGDEAFFRANADRQCLVAFTEMAGLMTNEELAATAKDPTRWRDVEIVPKGIVEPGVDVAVVSYEASAVRKGGEPYRALVSSGYVHRQDGWKLMFHSQTPLSPEEASGKQSS